jgi:hypothetical protein
MAAAEPQPVLAALGTRFDPRQARDAPPDEATVRRVAGRVDGDILADMIRSWLTQHEHTNIAQALRDTARNATRALTLLGIPT